MYSNILSLQSQRLLQIGILLILYASIDGFVIPFFGSPRIGLSVHTLSALQGIFLLALGAVWTRLKLGGTASRVAFWCLVYSTFAILAAYTLAAIWGAGIETIALAGELPHGLAQGSTFQEGLIKLLAYSSAPTGLVCFALVLWGFRIDAPARSSR
jgi:hydroxylaminobenzene mutase